MRIAAHHHGVAKKYAIRGWVGGKTFPLKDYFECIESGRAAFRQISPESADPDWPFLASYLSLLIDAEGALFAHVAKAGLEPTEKATWETLVEATAWVILSRYEEALKTSGSEHLK